MALRFTHLDHLLYRIALVLLVAGMVQPCGEARAEARGGISRVVHLTLAPSSKLWLEGTSTLHAYSSHATTMSAMADIELPTREADPNRALSRALREGTIEKFNFIVPVIGLKSKTDGIDKRLHKALKAKDHPTIRFELTSRNVKPHAVKSKTFLVECAGLLTVAGKTQDITLTAEAVVTTAGLHVTGSKQIRMSEYGVKPPKMMLGTIKTGDRVVVHFDVTFVTASTPSASL